MIQSSATYRFILASLFFLALGLMTSPTIVAGFQIFIMIPAIILFFQAKNKTISKSSMILLAVGVWALISAFYNLGTLHNASKSFREVGYYFYGVLFIFPLRYFFKNTNNKHLRFLLKLFLLTIVVAFFVGISKAWFKFDVVKFKYVPDHHDRSGGFFNYMRYGYGSAMLAILGAGMFFCREKIKEIISPKQLLTGVCFCVAAIGTSQCRGALLGLIAGGSFLLFRYQKKLFKILATLGAVFLIVVAIFSFNKISEYRFLNVNDGSNTARMTQWLSAFHAAKDNPIFGLGPDQFSYHAIEYKKKYNIGVQYYGAHAHNILLEHAADIGFIGVGLLILFFATWFFEMWSMKNDVGWIVGSYIIAFVVAGEVENLFDVVNSNLLFFVYSFSQYLYLEQKKTASA